MFWHFCNRSDLFVSAAGYYIFVIKSHTKWSIKIFKFCNGSKFDRVLVCWINIFELKFRHWFIIWMIVFKSQKPNWLQSDWLAHTKDFQVFEQNNFTVSFMSLSYFIRWSLVNFLYSNFLWRQSCYTFWNKCSIFLIWSTFQTIVINLLLSNSNST